MGQLKKEVLYLALLLLIFVAIFKIIFFRENLFSTVTFVSSYFWFFFIPGYALMLYWHDHLDFFSRLVAGFGLSVIITSFLNYYLGLIGITVAVHGYFIPPLLIAAGIIFACKSLRNAES
jgi:uncharacterized membrane protein